MLISFTLQPNEETAYLLVCRIRVSGARLQDLGDDTATETVAMQQQARMWEQWIRRRSQSPL